MVFYRCDTFSYFLSPFLPLELPFIPFQCFTSKPHSHTHKHKLSIHSSKCKSFVVCFMIHFYPDRANNNHFSQRVRTFGFSSFLSFTILIAHFGNEFLILSKQTECRRRPLIFYAADRKTNQLMNQQLETHHSSTIRKFI